MNISSASAWVSHWGAQIPAGATVLDVACGAGRHSHFLLERGFKVVATDIDLSGMDWLRNRAGLKLVQADLENAAWPFAAASFAAVIVTNYLHRPLFPQLISALNPGGMLIYETFAAGNEAFGRPSNPNFLLQPGELLKVVEGQMRVIAYEDVHVAMPKPAMVQRICAVLENSAPRYFRARGN